MKFELIKFANLVDVVKLPRVDFLAHALVDVIAPIYEWNDRRHPELGQLARLLADHYSGMDPDTKVFTSLNSRNPYNLFNSNLLSFKSSELRALGEQVVNSTTPLTDSNVRKLVDLIIDEAVYISWVMFSREHPGLSVFAGADGVSSAGLIKTATTPPKKRGRPKKEKEAVPTGEPEPLYVGTPQPVDVLAPGRVGKKVRRTTQRITSFETALTSQLRQQIASLAYNAAHAALFTCNALPTPGGKGDSFDRETTAESLLSTMIFHVDTADYIDNFMSNVRRELGLGRRPLVNGVPLTSDPPAHVLIGSSHEEWLEEAQPTESSPMAAMLSTSIGQDEDTKSESARRGLFKRASILGAEHGPSLIHAYDATGIGAHKRIGSVFNKNPDELKKQIKNILLEGLNFNLKKVRYSGFNINQWASMIAPLQNKELAAKAKKALTAVLAKLPEEFASMEEAARICDEVVSSEARQVDFTATSATAATSGFRREDPAFAWKVRARDVGVKGTNFLHYLAELVLKLPLSSASKLEAMDIRSALTPIPQFVEPAPVQLGETDELAINSDRLLSFFLGQVDTHAQPDFKNLIVDIIAGTDVSDKDTKNCFIECRKWTDATERAKTIDSEIKTAEAQWNLFKTKNVAPLYERVSQLKKAKVPPNDPSMIAALEELESAELQRDALKDVFSKTLPRKKAELFKKAEDGTFTSQLTDVALGKKAKPEIIKVLEKMKKIALPAIGKASESLKNPGRKSSQVRGLGPKDIELLSKLDPQLILKTVLVSALSSIDVSGSYVSQIGAAVDAFLKNGTIDDPKAFDIAELISKSFPPSFNSRRPQLVYDEYLNSYNNYRKNLISTTPTTYDNKGKIQLGKKDPIIPLGTVEAVIGADNQEFGGGEVTFLLHSEASHIQTIKDLMSDSMVRTYKENKQKIEKEIAESYVIDEATGLSMSKALAIDNTADALERSGILDKIDLGYDKFMPGAVSNDSLSAAEDLFKRLGIATTPYAKYDPENPPENYITDKRAGDILSSIRTTPDGPEKNNLALGLLSLLRSGLPIDSESLAYLEKNITEMTGMTLDFEGDPRVAAAGAVQNFLLKYSKSRVLEILRSTINPLSGEAFDDNDYDALLALVSRKIGEVFSDTIKEKVSARYSTKKATLITTDGDGKESSNTEIVDESKIHNFVDRWWRYPSYQVKGALSQQSLPGFIGLVLANRDETIKLDLEYIRIPNDVKDSARFGVIVAARAATEPQTSFKQVVDDLKKASNSDQERKLTKDLEAQLLTGISEGSSSLPTEVLEAAMALAKDAISEPIATSQGIYIVRVKAVEGDQKVISFMGSAKEILSTAHIEKHKESGRDAKTLPFVRWLGTRASWAVGHDFMFVNAEKNLANLLDTNRIGKKAGFTEGPTSRKMVAKDIKIFADPLLAARNIASGDKNGDSFDNALMRAQMAAGSQQAESYDIWKAGVIESLEFMRKRKEAAINATVLDADSKRFLSQLLNKKFEDRPDQTFSGSAFSDTERKRLWIIGNILKQPRVIENQNAFLSVVESDRFATDLAKMYEQAGQKIGSAVLKKKINAIKSSDYVQQAFQYELQNSKLRAGAAAARVVINNTEVDVGGSAEQIAVFKALQKTYLKDTVPGKFDENEYRKSVKSGVKVIVAKRKIVRSLLESPEGRQMLIAFRETVKKSSSSAAKKLEQMNDNDFISAAEATPELGILFDSRATMLPDADYQDLQQIKQALGTGVDVNAIVGALREAMEDCWQHIVDPNDKAAEAIVKASVELAGHASSAGNTADSMLAASAKIELAHKTPLDAALAKVNRGRADLQLFMKTIIGPGQLKTILRTSSSEELAATNAQLDQILSKFNFDPEVVDRRDPIIKYVTPIARSEEEIPLIRQKMCVAAQAAIARVKEGISSAKEQSSEIEQAADLGKKATGSVRHAEYLKLQNVVLSASLPITHIASYNKTLYESHVAQMEAWLRDLDEKFADDFDLVDTVTKELKLKGLSMATADDNRIRALLEEKFRDRDPETDDMRKELQKTVGDEPVGALALMDSFANVESNPDVPLKKLIALGSVEARRVKDAEPLEKKRAVLSEMAALWNLIKSTGYMQDDPVLASVKSNPGGIGYGSFHASLVDAVRVALGDIKYQSKGVSTGKPGTGKFDFSSVLAPYPNTLSPFDVKKIVARSIARIAPKLINSFRQIQRDPSQVEIPEKLIDQQLAFLRSPVTQKVLDDRSNVDKKREYIERLKTSLAGVSAAVEEGFRQEFANAQRAINGEIGEAVIDIISPMDTPIAVEPPAAAKADEENEKKEEQEDKLIAEAATKMVEDLDKISKTFDTSIRTAYVLPFMSALRDALRDNDLVAGLSLSAFSSVADKAKKDMASAAQLSSKKDISRVKEMITKLASYLSVALFGKASAISVEAKLSTQLDREQTIQVNSIKENIQKALEKLKKYLSDLDSKNRPTGMDIDEWRERKAAEKESTEKAIKFLDNATIEANRLDSKNIQSRQINLVAINQVFTNYLPLQSKEIKGFSLSDEQSYDLLVSGLNNANLQVPLPGDIVLEEVQNEESPSVPGIVSIPDKGEELPEDDTSTIEPVSPDTMPKPAIGAGPVVDVVEQPSGAEVIEVRPVPAAEPVGGRPSAQESPADLTREQKTIMKTMADKIAYILRSLSAYQQRASGQEKDAAQNNSDLLQQLLSKLSALSASEIADRQIELSGADSALDSYTRAIYNEMKSGRLAKEVAYYDFVANLEAAGFIMNMPAEIEVVETKSPPEEAHPAEPAFVFVSDTAQPPDIEAERGTLSSYLTVQEEAAEETVAPVEETVAPTQETITPIEDTTLEAEQPTVQTESLEVSEDVPAPSVEVSEPMTYEVQEEPSVVVSPDLITEEDDSTAQKKEQAVDLLLKSIGSAMRTVYSAEQAGIKGDFIARINSEIGRLSKLRSNVAWLSSVNVDALLQKAEELLSTAGKLSDYVDSLPDGTDMAEAVSKEVTDFLIASYAISIIKKSASHSAKRFIRVADNWIF